MNFTQLDSEKTRLGCSLDEARKTDSAVHIVQTAVFGSSEEISKPVPVEIDRRGAYVVPFYVSIGKWTNRLKMPWGLAGGICLLSRWYLQPQLCIFRVEQPVQVAIIVPIDDCEFASTRSARLFVVELQWLSFLVEKTASWRF